MSNSWDSYWKGESNESYWLKPDSQVVEIINQLDRSQIRRVLDLGCGIGRHSLLLAEAGFEVTAADSSIQALSVLNSRISSKPYRINVVHGTYCQDLFPDAYFDFILAYNVLYHGYRNEFERAIRLVYKWWKSGGWFFFTCPSQQDGKFGDGEQVAPNTFKSTYSIHPGDIHYFASKAEIEQLLDNFSEISNNIFEHHWNNNGVIQFSSYWQVLAKK